MVYVTPEKITKSKKLLNRLENVYDNNYFNRIVIDEAHCCSQWGHDFRKAFKSLNILRRQFKNVPILACTATATDEVLKDTMKILSFARFILFIYSLLECVCNKQRNEERCCSISWII